MNRLNARGYTLVEVLVATALLGIVVAGIYSSYLGMQRTVYTQEEVVDVQRNLRLALQVIARDIRMAGMGLPKSSLRIDDTSTATNLDLLTASAIYTFARLEENLLIPSSVSPADAIEIEVATPVMADRFTSGQKVRIVRPQIGRQPLDDEFIVAGVDRTVPSVTLQNIDTTAEVQLVAGDLIMQTDTFPSTISYTLGSDNALLRSVNGGEAKPLGVNVTGLELSYLLDDGTESAAPADFSKIRAVRVTLDGQNLRTDAYQGNLKERQLTSTIKLRNR